MILTGKIPKYLERNLCQCQFVHHKFYMKLLGINSDLEGEGSATNCLNDGTTHDFQLIFHAVAHRLDVIAISGGL